MIWDAIHDWKTRQLEKKVARVEDVADRARDDSRSYAEKLQHLALATEAVWSFLKEKHALDDEDLVQRMQEIDLHDGVRDRRTRPVPTTCESCGRRMNSIHMTCIYCGTPNKEFNPFAS